MMTINQRGEDTFSRPHTERMSGFPPPGVLPRHPITAPVDAHLATAGLQGLQLYPASAYGPRFQSYPFYPHGTISDPAAAMLYPTNMNHGEAAEAWRAGQFQAAATAAYYDPTMVAHYSYPYAHIGLGEGARRKNATRETTSTLKAWLNEHRKNPYPTKAEKIMLAIVTRMTLTQVSTWFANARRRLKKENKMTWSPRNRCGEDDEDDEDGQVAGGGSAANDLSSRTSSPILIDVDETSDKIPSCSRIEENNQLGSEDVSAFNQKLPEQQRASNHNDQISIDRNKNNEAKVDFMIPSSIDAKAVDDSLSLHYPYRPYHTPIRSYPNTHSLVASRFSVAGAAVPSSNIPVPVSGSGLSAGRLSFPTNPPQLHGSSVPPLQYLNNPFAQTASILAASRPHPTLSPQFIAALNSSHANLQRHYHTQVQQMNQFMSTTQACERHNPSPTFSDVSANITSARESSSSSTVTSSSKSKIWSIADVATSDDPPAKKPYDPVNKSSNPTLPFSDKSKSDEDTTRSDGRRWMEQLIQQRNSSSYPPINFGIQPQLNGLTPSPVGIYHSTFGAVDESRINFSNKTFMTATSSSGRANFDEDKNFSMHSNSDQRTEKKLPQRPIDKTIFSSMPQRNHTDTTSSREGSTSASNTSSGLLINIKKE